MPIEYGVLTGVLTLAIAVDVWCYIEMRNQVTDLREDVEALKDPPKKPMGFTH